jgi:hypothetical protein
VDWVEWLTALMAAGLVPVVFGFFQGNCPCCGGVGEPCEEAWCDPSTTPDEIQVTFAGISNRPFTLGCHHSLSGGCTWFNGRTFLLPKLEGSCQWQMNFQNCALPNGTDRVVVQFFATGSDVWCRVTLVFPGPTSFAVWEGSMGAFPIDCSAINVSPALTTQNVAVECQSNGTAVTVFV